MTTSPTIVTDVPTVQRPEHRVAGHIRDAAQKTGVPFEFLLAQANQESRLNPEAKNSKSSAMGLFQFTSGTWLEMVKSHGAEHGLEKYADAIARGADGRWTVKDKALKKEILDLRRDPALSALMAAEYAKDNEQVLEAKLGRQVSTQDLYLAHFLGAGGALKVLRGRHLPEDEQQPADLAGAARANPSVFMDPASGEQRSLASVYAAVERRFRNAMSEANRLAGNLNPQVDLAALRPEERPGEPAAEPASAAIASAPADPGGAPAAAAPSPASTSIGPIDLAGGAVAMTMADIPAAISNFPARLPPRPASLGAPPAAPAYDSGQSFPVPLPPPVTGQRADAATFETLLAANEERG